MRHKSSNPPQERTYTRDELKLTYTRDEVAEALGLTPDQFEQHRRRKALAEADFPGKLPGCPGWSKVAVDHWINTGGLQYPPLLDAAVDDNGEAAGIAKAARQLEDKYADDGEAV